MRLAFVFFSLVPVTILSSRFPHRLYSTLPIMSRSYQLFHNFSHTLSLSLSLPSYRPFYYNIPSHLVAVASSLTLHLPFRTL